MFSIFRKPKIEVFVRYCYYSYASGHKERHLRFSHEKCYHNLMDNTDFSKVNFTFLLDTHYKKDENHFIKGQKRFPVIEIDVGYEAKSFLFMLDQVFKQRFSDDTLIYFLEDDYLHQKKWADILLEGLSLPNIDYVTLYDDRDKYDADQYVDLTSRIFYTKRCHWRTTPSTTNTYAMKFATLSAHEKTHREFSLNRKISSDNAKFCKLREMGAILISPIPGWATHCDPQLASPCIDWDKCFL